MSNTTQHSSHIPSNMVPQFPDVFKGKNNDLGSHKAQIEQEKGEAIDMELLGKEFGVLHVDPTQTMYLGGQHWVSIMFQIQEFRDYLEANSGDLQRVAVENKKASEGNENVVSLLRSTNAPLTKEELLSYIPSRIVTDMLIARFFSHVSYGIPVVHEPTFRQEYIKHWENPDHMEVTWLGLLFSILHHADLSFDGSEENHLQSRAAEYRRRTVQCLIAANYTDPQVYTVEALILHTYAEWVSSPDSAIELGKILAFVEAEDDPTHDDISKYEKSLEEVKRMTPQYLTVSSTQELTIVSAKLHKQRLGLDRLYQTSQCVLHRKSLSQARHDSSKLQHRGLCIDAAMALLAHQATLYNLDLDSSSPQNFRKRHMYTLMTRHDFFIASMAIALDLYYGFESEPYAPSSSDVSLWGYDRRNEMIAALETSVEFYRFSKDESVEAANAYGMFSFVVEKVRKAQWMIIEQQSGGNSSTAGHNSNSDTTAPVPELGTEFFNDPLPDFDWNIWNQFHGNYGDLEPFTQWEGMA
ncbi:hypothetical protein G7Y89_g6212 [Cudoniella acicularis]|uniref:Transcription factor domain-containing protein n=1 Tax=Cudoniella acicularis TaxID=354080 RepID=A0A8H4RLS2_9HELO|nr:hypothetical protein G7Y89_g6212 [Cudoniella acicularis]